MSTHVLLAIILAVVVVAVLALALIEIRRRLLSISSGLATLSGALEGVEAEHLRPARAGRRGDQLAVRDHRRRAAGDRAQGRDRRRAEAVMTGVWIGAALLILVVFPIVVVLLKGVLDAAAGIVPTVDAIAATAAKGSADLDATALLLTTQQQARTTIELVAAYGGSLDVILDDAGPAA